MGRLKATVDMETSLNSSGRQKMLSGQTEAMRRQA